MYFDPQYCFSARPRQLTVNQSKNPTTDALVHLKGQSYEKTDSTKATGESIRSQNRNGTDIRLSRRPDIRSNMRLGQVTGNFLLRENVSEQMLTVVYFRLDIPPHPIYGVPVRILVEQKSGRPDIRQNQYQHSLKKNCLVQKECDLAIFIYTANQTDEMTILYHGRQNMGDKHTRKHKRRSWFTPGFEPAGLPLLSPELLVLLPLHLPLLLDGV